MVHNYTRIWIKTNVCATAFFWAEAEKLNVVVLTSQSLTKDVPNARAFRSVGAPQRPPLYACAEMAGVGVGVGVFGRVWKRREALGRRVKHGGSGVCGVQLQRYNKTERTPMVWEPKEQGLRVRSLDEMPYRIRVITHEWIVMSDGTRLAARIWLPVSEIPVPALLEYIPYRKNDLTAFRCAQAPSNHLTCYM